MIWLLNKYAILCDKANDENAKKSVRIGALNKKALIDEFLLDFERFIKSCKDDENCI